jgi:hypothetical protein
MVATLQGPFGPVAVTTPNFTIGYASDNQLVLNDPNVSLHHALIRMETQNASIVDLGSANGTYVNEQRLEQNSARLLHTGDTIRIGNTTFRYEASQLGSFADYPPPPPYIPNTPNPYEEETWIPPESNLSNNSISPVNPSPQTEPRTQPFTSPPEPANTNNQLKILLIAAAAVIVLGVAGGGLLFYKLTRPQPLITVASQYQVNMTPAGSASTSFRVNGQHFSGTSAITFLLDGQTIPGNPTAESDNNGNLTTTLTVTSAWPQGNHTLTAQDASGNTTQNSVAIAIVPQGQAHTPGPNGAPPDDATFTISASYIPNGETPEPITLSITGKADPNGGSICTPGINSSQGTYNGTYNETDNIGQYTDIYTLTCSGTYKGGKLSFSEMVASDVYNYTNGVICSAQTPYALVHLEGTFSNATSISGSFSSGSESYNCTEGATYTRFALQGTWTGQVQ